MEPWAAWSGSPALTFINARVAQLLRRQGVEDGFVDIDGHPIHYYAAGPLDADRTVVLLHGLGVSSNDWWRTLPLLAWRGDRVIALDLPGHGLTPPFDERGYALVREHADMVRKVVERMQVGGETALVGHSLGGWVAARAHLAGLPAQKLVLVEAAGVEFEGMWETIELLRIEREEDVQRYFRTICHRQPFGLQLVAKEVASMFKTPAVTGFIGCGERGDFLGDEDLARITADTTLIWGENDGLIPPIIAHKWNAGIEGSRLVWLPKCGHAPQLERPLLFQAVLEEALGHPPLADEIRTRLTSVIPDALKRRLSKT
jgi:pimeloyl-ACP methyl ester carboxylesterase